MGGKVLVLSTDKAVNESRPKKEGEDRDNMEPGADVIRLDFNIKEKQ